MGGMRTRLKRGMIERSRQPRARPTDAERRLWCKLRDFKAGGFHFRRQAPFRSYVLDFVEHSARLVVELDGGQHGEARQESRDKVRDRILQDEGYRVLRFWNDEVLRNVDAIADYILFELKQRPPTRTASPPDLPTRGR